MPTSIDCLHRLPAQYAPKRMVPSLHSSLSSSQGRRRQMSHQATLLPKPTVPCSFAGKSDRTLDLRLLPYDADVCTWRTVSEMCGVQSCDTCEHELRRPSSAAAAAATAKVCPALLLASAKTCADFGMHCLHYWEHHIPSSLLADRPCYLQHFGSWQWRSTSSTKWSTSTPICHTVCCSREPPIPRPGWE